MFHINNCINIWNCYIVTLGKLELTFLLKLYFHDQICYYENVICFKITHLNDTELHFGEEFHQYGSIKNKK